MKFILMKCQLIYFNRNEGDFYRSIFDIDLTSIALRTRRTSNAQLVGIFTNFDYHLTSLKKGNINFSSIKYLENIFLLITSQLPFGSWSRIKNQNAIWTFAAGGNSGCIQTISTRWMCALITSTAFLHFSIEKCWLLIGIARRSVKCTITNSTVPEWRIDVAIRTKRISFTVRPSNP